MTSKLTSHRTRSFQTALLGAVFVIFGFTTYPAIVALNLNRGIGNEVFVVYYAYFALALDLLGLCMLFYGGTVALTKWSPAGASRTELSVLGAVASAFNRTRYSQLVIASACLYGMFYAFASGIVVFQPTLSFSEAYHIGIPSWAIATCCEPLGETPQLVVYVSQHLGIILVPVNLLLLFSISWLVGFNTSFASFALSFRKQKVKMGWFGGIGAFLGLFASCPSCAGLAIISLIGGTGTLSASFFLGPLQTVMLLVSIPILIASPFLSARSLCSLDARTRVLT